MGRRWQPNKAQRVAYAKSMQEQDEKYDFIRTGFPIRLGCQVEFVRKTTGEVVSGEVITSSYGPKTGQHTFNVDGVLVKGRNLYDRLLYHNPGAQSFTDAFYKTYRVHPSEEDLIRVYPEYKERINKVFNQGEWE